MVPFVWGGAEDLAANLKKNLILAGHQAEILRIPFQWHPPERIPSQMLMVKGFELVNVDRVIGLKFPAYLISHPDKIFWLAHQYRQAYDLYGTDYSNLPRNEQGENLRQIIIKGDNAAFTEANRIYTVSKTVQQRLFHYNNFNSEVLTAPLNDPEIFTGSSKPGKYIFAGGRVNRMKRQYLLVEAMAFASPKVKLVIAGPPDNPQEGEHLQRLVETLGLTDRVKLDLRFLSRAELAKYVNESLACAYLPFNEDSMGYVLMESAQAGKALITATDCGGTLELVRHLRTGWVCDPAPKAIAEILTKATLNCKLAINFGLVARSVWQGMQVDWPTTVARLLK